MRVDGIALTFALCSCVVGLSASWRFNMRFWALVVILVGTAGLVNGQSFPIRAMGEPVWPVDRGLNALPWEEGLGTMDRVGDLNGDGVDDLVVLLATQYNNFVEDRFMWLYLGEKAEDGSVSYGNPERLLGFDLESGYISDFVIHDHNGDGFNDLLFVTDHRHEIEVWANTPAGFVIGMTLHTEKGGYLEGQRILIEDIDQDGDEDYLVYGQDYSVIWSKQTNEIFSYETVPFMVYDSEWTAAITDVDGDGDMDLVAIDQYDGELYGRLQVDGYWFDPDDPHENEEDYEFEASLDAGNFEYSNTAACFADVNGDGMMDVVGVGYADLDDAAWALGYFLAPFSQDESQVIPVFGIPDFENAYSQSFRNIDGWERALQSPGDLDGDGTDDLLLFPQFGRHSGWRISDPMNLNGRRAVYNELDVHGEGVIQQSDDFDLERFAYEEAYSDVNDDGVKDRIVPTFAERFDYGGEIDPCEQVGLMVWGVLANPMKRDAVLMEQDAIDTVGAMAHVLAVDLDDDGDVEIITTKENSLSLHDRDVDGLYRRDRGTRFAASDTGFRTVIASMDGDPTPDLLSLRLDSGGFAPTCFLNPVLSYFGDTTVNFDVFRDQDLEVLLDDQKTYFESDGNSFSTGDVDGDGTTDIVIRGQVNVVDGYEGDSVLVWLNDGAGVFSLGPISPVEHLDADIHTYNMELVDADQDGVLDVVCVETGIDGEGYSIGVYLNDGTGSFTLDQMIPIANLFDLDPYWITVEDVDGDAFDDVVVLLKNNRDAHEAIIAYGGEAGFESEVHRWAGGNAAELMVVDLDGDGMKDLLSCAYEDTDDGLKNSVSMMFQGAAREFGPMVSISDMDLSGINVADLDGDGGLDLIACSSNSVGNTDYQIIRVYPAIDDVCSADLNFDGSLNYLDISLFIKMVGEGRAVADLDHDGVFGFGDVNAFLNAYNNGCAWLDRL